MGKRKLQQENKFSRLAYTRSIQFEYNSYLVMTGKKRGYGYDFWNFSSIPTFFLSVPSASGRKLGLLKRRVVRSRRLYNILFNYSLITSYWASPKICSYRNEKLLKTKLRLKLVRQLYAIIQRFYSVTCKGRLPRGTEGWMYRSCHICQLTRECMKIT